MSTATHHDPSRPRQHITIVTTDQGPQVGPYIFGKTLGTGSTGKVKLAKNVDTDEIVAIKIVRKDSLDNKPSLKKKMRREISVLKVLSHPNLMSLIDVFEIETHLFLVMEFVDGLELFEYLVRRGALPIPQALGFFQQIICGLEYCHHRLICHRDLKPENLLLDRNLNIKIADFGMTSLNPPGSLLATSCGSPHYCDPMVVSGGKYDGLKADIWSCGVILYAMVTGRLPFDDDNIQRLLQKVQMGQYHLPSDLPSDLRDLIRQMLTVDPEERITLDGIKAHPWFNSIKSHSYVEDNFVAPTEPVLRPDPIILRSLVDLGWGDVQSITKELARPGPSMEKAFYQQLERHPIIRRNATPHAPDARLPPPTLSAPGVVASTTPRHPTRAGAPVHEKATPAQAPQPNAQTPVPAQPQAKPDASEQLRKQMENVSLSNEAAQAVHVADNTASVPATKSSGTPSSGTNQARLSEPDDVPTASNSGTLVRQSSLMRISPDGGDVTKNDHRVEEAIQTVSGGNQKSWFDSMKSLLTGQNEADKDKEVRMDSKPAGESR